MSAYKLQENEIQFTLNTPTAESKNFISCILSKPVENGYHETKRAAMLMHGIGSQKNSNYQSKLARKLSKEQGMYVVRFDFRNCGDSSKTGKLGRTLNDDLDDMSAVYEWLSGGGFEGKKLFVDTLIGHSRGVVDVFNWQLNNMDKFVINLVACAGRFIGHGLPDSIRKNHPDFENKGGHYIRGFQDGAYTDVWIPLEETQSLGVLHMKTVQKITCDTDTLCIYGTREQVIPLQDAAHYVNCLGDRNTMAIIPGADHCFRGIVKIPENEWATCDKPINKNTGFIDYNYEVTDIVANWMSPESMNERFFEKNKNIHKFLKRWKNIDGVYNCRDIGGWNTKNGKIVKFNKVFRSSNLSEITQGGITKIKELGIKKIFDLRLPIEKSWANGNKYLENEEDFEITPLISSTLDLEIENIISIMRTKQALNYAFNVVDVYDNILNGLIPFYKPIFQHFIDDPEVPVLIHCNMGKDETSVVIMLLLLVCGVDPLIVAGEYSLSTQGIKEDFISIKNMLISQTSFQEKLQKCVDTNKPTLDWSFTKDGISNLLESQSTTMLDIITLLNEKYGGVETYLQNNIGFTLTEIEQIKENMTLKVRN